MERQRLYKVVFVLLILALTPMLMRQAFSTAAAMPNLTSSSKVLVAGRAIASWPDGIPAGEKRPVVVFLPGWNGAGAVDAFTSPQNTNLLNAGYVTLAVGFDDLGGWTTNINAKTLEGLNLLCADAAIPARCDAIVLDGGSYGGAQNYWVTEYLRGNGYAGGTGKVLGFLSEDAGYSAPGTLTDPATGAFTRTGLADTANYSVAMIQNLGDTTFPVDSCDWGNCGARTLSNAHQARGDTNVFSVCPAGGEHGARGYADWDIWVLSAIKTMIHVTSGIPTFTGYTAPSLAVSNTCVTTLAQTVTPTVTPTGMSITPTVTQTVTSTVMSITQTVTPTVTPIPANTVNLSVDGSASRKPISPYVYGLNFAKPAFAKEIGLPARRWGGNTFLRYNWQNGNANTALDWYFENVQVSNAFDWNIQETHNTWIAENKLTGADSIITIPMLGYVAKNATSCGFSIAKYGAQQDQDVWRPDCGNGKDTLGANITGNDPLDTSVAAPPAFMQSWVADMVAKYGAASSSGVKFYALDNEPELWNDTHRDVHPTAQTYQELYDKTVAYASAVKAADPSAKTLGYVSYGWTGYWYSQSDAEAAAANGYTYFPDYATHGNKYQAEWYLAQMHQYEVDHGIRLLDYFDLHYYPSNGVDLTTVGDAAMQALRLRATRSLWDPTYIDESWIGGAGQTFKEVKLIPRMRGWVDANYPGTKLAITEYNFGGLEDINGALAQADALGIFGREGVDLATLWNYPLPDDPATPKNEDPVLYNVFETLPGAYAFRIYRNYDGAGGKFGETSVSAASADQSKLAVYAAQRSADNALTLVIINKTADSISSTVSLTNFAPATNAQVYRYGAASLNGISHLADQAVTSAGFTSVFPANSITLVVIPSTATLSVTVKSVGVNDGWILESGEKTNKGGTKNSIATTFNLGDDANNKQYRGILHFDTTLPAGAVVSSATLKIRKMSQVGAGINLFTKLGGLLVDTKKPSFGASALELGDFQATGALNVAKFGSAPIGGWYVASIGSAYINTAGTTQFRLRFKLDDNNDFQANYLKFYSGSAGANSPQLVIEYTP